MNVLFLSLIDFETFYERNIYSDLLREFIKNGHSVNCISPIERRRNQKTRLLRFRSSTSLGVDSALKNNFNSNENTILKLKIGNTQKINLIEKGISTLCIESLFIRGIKIYYSDIKFDLVLYATPPITFAKVIQFVKQRDGAKSYLMLKDIFPQNSLDLGILTKTGVMGLIYKYFREKEKHLYTLSDKIGCMSQGNIDYVLKHNPEVSKDKVKICPNCVEPIDMRVSVEEKIEIRRKYGLPVDKKIFIYGGNLGKPQDVPFIVECLKSYGYKGNVGEEQIGLNNAYFVIAGSGTDRHFLEEYVENDKPNYVKLFNFIPKAEYDKMIACCDVGLIFLDHRFTIPNFPSRLLSYMQAGLPVLVCTDKNTDIGHVVVGDGFGWWCESDDADGFALLVAKICNATSLDDMSKAAFDVLVNEFNVRHSYRQIIESFD
ncbi:glycosyltransferase family 4 protein [Holdemania massiliensis]|uniref:glycosyltransferase family 4 protein n=1 Tax=Holdemania massiliensis TaxID=1468449 RepID=UPI001F05F355|nr:glycosyltransferase family 4 protein [Holdemania massiliensis]MCH1941120.1 glycosyltransferase family 4 protein [Holdemania massiliensis]